MMINQKINRFIGIVGLGSRRILEKLENGGLRRSRLWIAILGVAISILLMTTVSAVALGVSHSSLIHGEGTNYWIVPEEASGGIGAQTGGARLGDAHRLTEELTTDKRVTYATPVLIQLVSVTATESKQQEYVLLIGVIPSSGDPITIDGVDTAPLSSGDPYYANGTYNGRWTGEMIVNDAAAELLEVSPRDRLRVSTKSSREFKVVNISKGGGETGLGSVPVGIVHLSELQSLTGAHKGDAADQILVAATSNSVKPRLESLYPKTNVRTSSGLSGIDRSTSSLPLAMGIAAFAISTLVGVLFVGTMMGLETAGQKRELAIMGAIGISARTQAIFLAIEILIIAVLGGLIGVTLGWGASKIINILSHRFVGTGEVASFSPILIGYGIGVSLLIGLFAAIYPILILRRISPLSSLS